MSLLPLLLLLALVPPRREPSPRDPVRPWVLPLLAAAAVLAMIPLTRSVLWGPMAVAIMGGLFVATALTLLFLPALYAAWFRVRRPEPVPTVGDVHVLP